MIGLGGLMFPPSLNGEIGGLVISTTGKTDLDVLVPYNCQVLSIAPVDIVLKENGRHIMRGSRLKKGQTLSIEELNKDQTTIININVLKV